MSDHRSYFSRNNTILFNSIKEMTKEQLETYLNEQDYLKKYDFIKIITL